MKHPKPDIGDSIRSEFISNVSTIRKLLRYWGTETIEGTPVLKQRKYYYPRNWSKNDEKLFRFLGMYDDIVSSEMEGIEAAWVYFNKSKEKTAVENTALSDFILHNLNLMWWDPDDGPRPEGLTLTTTIVIEGLFQSNTSGSYEDEVLTTPLLNYTWPTSLLITEINNNYDALWDTCLISQQGVGIINKGSFTDPVTKVVTPDEDDLSPNDSWMQTVARLALRSDGIPCTIKDVEVGLAYPNRLPFRRSRSVYPTYVVTIEIPYIEFVAGMGIVNHIIAGVNGTYSSVTHTKLSYSNNYYTQQALKKLEIDDLETDTTLLTRPYMPWTEANIGSYESIWFTWGGGIVNRLGKVYTKAAAYALKADALENPRAYGYTYKELVNYLLPLLDSDYQKKKAKWWQKLLAVVVFIVAVVLAYPTGGGSLALAKAILVGVLVVTILSAVLAAAGQTEWAMAFAEVNKMVEPLAWVAMLVLIVTGISAAIESAKKAVAEAAAKEVADVTVKEIAKELASSMAENVVEGVLTGAKDLVTGRVTGASLKLLTQMMSIFKQVQATKLESINDRNKDLASEYEQMMEDAELENDVLRGFMRVYSSPATADWSMYTSLFDVPYEGTGGALHTGNVQRTTKQALRKTEYDDPAFNGILII